MVADLQKTVLLSQLTKVDPSSSGRAQGNTSSSTASQADFERTLDQQNAIQFSKHAEKRLQSRQIELSSADQTKLRDAVGALQKKGAKDSLVLMGELAFIVNVPSKTVVTAMAKDQMNEQVFTNIDSTMLVNR